MTVILGIDLGARRIGLALAEDLAPGPAADPVDDRLGSPPARARPLVTIPRRTSPAADAAALATIIAQHGVDELVVGLPLEASGAVGAQARLTRDWAEAVGATLARPMSYRDERLTSHLAEQRLGPMPRGRSGGPPTAHQRSAYRARVDREAAAIILQDELDARATAAGRATTGSTS